MIRSELLRIRYSLSARLLLLVIVAEAIFIGLEESVRRMRTLMDAAR